MNKEEFLSVWKQFLLVNYDKIISGDMKAVFWQEVKDFQDQNHEDIVEKKFWAAYDAEGNYPEPEDPNKEYTIETKEFGPITVDAETYHKYYDKLISL